MSSSPINVLPGGQGSPSSAEPTNLHPPNLPPPRDSYGPQPNFNQPMLHPDYYGGLSHVHAPAMIGGPLPRAYPDYPPWRFIRHPYRVPPPEQAGPYSRGPPPSSIGPCPARVPPPGLPGPSTRPQRTFTATQTPRVSPLFQPGHSTETHPGYRGPSLNFIGSRTP